MAHTSIPSSCDNTGQCQHLLLPPASHSNSMLKSILMKSRGCAIVDALLSLILDQLMKSLSVQRIDILVYDRDDH